MSNHVDSTPLYDVTKRFFDLSLSIVCLVVLLPVLTIILLLVLVTAGKPVFYLGRRIGRYGKVFEIIKFRTMIVNAEKSGTTTALNDPRITCIGKFLRKWKVDELPQLFNILKGEMSFVGPRPEVEEHTNDYSEEERQILTVLPGLTDYASIRFISLDKVLGSENPHHVYLSRVRREKNLLRLKYVRERSFLTDIKIIILTLVMLMRKITGISG